MSQTDADEIPRFGERIKAIADEDPTVKWLCVPKAVCKIFDLIQGMREQGERVGGPDDVEMRELWAQVGVIAKWQYEQRRTRS